MAHRIEKQLSKKEKKERLKTKILILEDEYAQQAKEGLNLPYLKTKVITSIEELKKLNPEKFTPDIIILDLEVPDKKGEVPKEENVKISTKIAKEKFKDAIIVYYTSSFHHGRISGGIGDSPEVAKKNGVKLYLEDKYEELLKIDPEVEYIGDKSKIENWRKILELIPIVHSGPNLAEKLKLFAFWPKKIKNKIIAFKKIDDPKVAESMQKFWEAMEK